MECEDADPEVAALWPLFVKIQPSLTSLLHDLASWNADRLGKEAIRTDDELVKIGVEEPCSSETNDGN